MTNIIKSQKLIMTKYGENFRDCIEIIDDHIEGPEEDQILVKNIYAGVNGVYDLNMVRNKVSYIQFSPPHDLGIEAVGVIIKTGRKIRDLKKGDYVSTWSIGGGYKHYQLLRKEFVTKIPEATPEILTLLPTGISGMIGIEQVGQMTSNEVIAISAAAGGLGHLIVQFAKMKNNHVIGICGSDLKEEAIRELGCDRIINYNKEDLNKILTEEYPSGINIAYDSVGGKVFDAFINNLSVKGRLIISGYTSEVGKPWEQIVGPRIYEKLYFKSASVRGFINPHFLEFHEEAKKRILRMYQSNKLKVLVDNSYFNGLKAVPDAVEYLLSGKNIGKVVIKF